MKTMKHDVSIRQDEKGDVYLTVDNTRYKVYFKEIREILEAGFLSSQVHVELYGLEVE